jgi:protein SCO1/2
MISRVLFSLAVAAALACSVVDAQVPDHPVGHVHELLSPAVLPGESLYQLPVVLDTADGRHAELASLAGMPVVVAMFYSSCTTVCPMLTLQMQHLELALDPAARSRVKFVLISLDSERDTPAKLAEFAAEHHLDTSRWLIGHAAPADVRAVAAALGVRYRQLPDKSFSHSALITLLNSAGVPVARTQTLAGDDPAFLAALRALLP